MKSFYQTLFLFLLSLTALTWTGCEQIFDDTDGPSVEIIKPQGYDNYNVLDTIEVRAKIKDNRNINWVKVDLVDNNGKSVCSPISIEDINQNGYYLFEKYPLDNMQLATDDYSLQVEASDGPNISKEQQYLNITAAKKKLKYFLVITKTNSEEVSITKLDTNYGNKQFIFSEPTDFLDSRYISKNQQLIISGKSNYETKAFHIPDFTMEWSVPASNSSQNSPLTSIEDNNELIALGSYDGIVRLFDKTGNKVQEFSCSSGMYLHELGFTEDHVTTAEQYSGDYYVSLYFKDSGNKDQEKLVSGKIIDLYTRTGDFNEYTRLIIIGNSMGGGCIWHYNTDHNSLWQAPRLFSEISTTCKISEDYYLVGTGQHIMEHSYDPPTTIYWVKNISPDRLEYDPVTKTVLVIKGKTIYFYDWDSATLKNSVQMDSQVLNVHPVYNK